MVWFGNTLGYQAFVKDVAELREDFETLRMENTRLIIMVEAQSKEHNGQFTRLLEIIKNIKEEVDVNRVVSGHDNHRAEKVYSYVTCDIFPCLDLHFLEHYTELGNIRCYNAKAARDRDGPR
jgi:hypothetical protein